LLRAMPTTHILFWIVSFAALSLLYSSVRHENSAARGWMIKSVAILVVLMFASQLQSRRFVFYAAALWVILALLPNLLIHRYDKYIFNQDFAAGRRIARIISILHPFDGWLEQPRIARALELAKQGDIESAKKILYEFRDVTSPGGATAIVSFYRITHQWEELLTWMKQQPGAVEGDPAFAPTILRARGEVGDVRGLVELFHANRNEILRMGPTTSDFCRLVLFAFCGRRDLVERLFETGLNALADETKQFWLATADIASGKTEIARKNLESQLRSADPWSRRAIERRLAKPLPTPEVLDPAHLKVIEEAAVEHTHEQMFDVAPPLREAAATRSLIFANLAVFGLEILRGGATNQITLINLGAVVGDYVHHGQWWRLFTATFLHWGALHIAMNMINLSVIGPFVENAFGRLRYLALYLIAGTGSMFVVITLSRESQITVGASGAIMGLVGATGGLMLKGWLYYRAHPAKRRLTAILTIIALQTIFDWMIPQVSMTAHLSGALIGFLTAIFLPSKLNLNPNTN
jgi:rhomboid protease GluP